VKLLERALVKQLLLIPYADLQFDPILDGLIEAASDQAQTITRRQFLKAQRTEIYPSYDLDDDPEPQFILTDAVPIDSLANITVGWSPYSDRSSETLFQPTTGAIAVDYEKGKITFLNPNLYGTRTALLAPPRIGYAPQGFRITYTGGYEASTKPTGEPADPTDDYGVIQAPAGLKMILATKIATDFKASRTLLPWTLDQRASLSPYEKKDRL
jgi:hypothetical protein